MVAVALALSCGIAIGRYTQLPTGLWAFAHLAALLAAIATFRKPHLHIITAALVAAAIFAAGALHVRLCYFHIPNDHIVSYSAPSPIFSTIRGKIATAPRTFDAGGGVEFGYRRGPRTTMLVEARSIRTGETWSKTSGLVSVTVKEPAEALAVGQRVELVGRLGRFSSPNNPGQDDRAQRARSKHCMVNFTIESADGAKIISPKSSPGPTTILWRLRASLRQHLAGLGDETSQSLLSAMLVGERSPALRDLNQAMVNAGVAHFLSISGLHLGVFLGFVFLICRLISLSPRKSAVIVLVVLGFYILMAEPRAPLLRSALMGASLCVAIIAGRRHSALNALSAAAVVLLVIDPLQLLNAGFQLSFVIVAALLLVCRDVEYLLFGRWKRRRGLMVFRGDQRVRRWIWHTAGNYLTGSVAMAITAYLAAAPLVALHFGIFTPYAALLSLLLFPFVLAVLIPGYLAMALAGVLPNLSHAIGNIAAGSADILAAVVQSLDVLPWMSFELRPLPWIAAGLCYLTMIVIIMRRRFRRVKIWIAVCLLAAAGTCGWSQLPAAAPAQAELHILAVGAGQCAVLRTPGGKVVLIDAGTQSGYDAFDRVLQPFLRTNRLPAPSAAFISHANTDHFNALAAMLKRDGIDTVYLNEYFGKDRNGEPPPRSEAQFMNLLKARAASIVRLSSGDGRKISLDSRTEVEVIWPPANRNDLSANERSLVLKITCDGRSILIPGDADEIAQAHLAKMGDIVKADVLILPHHGSWRNTLEEFVTAVDPEIVLVSGVRDPAARKTLPPAARKFYADLKAHRNYRSTARNGWIRIKLNPDGPTIHSMRR